MITFTNPDSNKNSCGGGMLVFAWYIWEKEVEGKPTMDWI